MTMIEIFLLTVLAIGLVSISAIDIRTMRVPDRISLPLILFGLYWAFLHDALVNSLLGATFGYAAFWLISKGYQRIRHRSGLGMGDAKLLSVGGAWFGLSSLPMVVMISAGLAIFCLFILSRFRNRAMTEPIAFAPFLSVGIGYSALEFIELTVA